MNKRKQGLFKTLNSFKIKPVGNRVDVFFVTSAKTSTDKLVASFDSTTWFIVRPLIELNFTMQLKKYISTSSFKITKTTETILNDEFGKEFLILMWLVYKNPFYKQSISFWDGLVKEEKLWLFNTLSSDFNFTSSSHLSLILMSYNFSNQEINELISSLGISNQKPKKSTSVDVVTTSSVKSKKIVKKPSDISPEKNAEVLNSLFH
jgi:hypothetical protein